MSNIPRGSPNSPYLQDPKSQKVVEIEVRFKYFSGFLSGDHQETLEQVIMTSVKRSLMKLTRRETEDLFISSLSIYVPLEKVESRYLCSVSDSSKKILDPPNSSSD